MLKTIPDRILAVVTILVSGYYLYEMLTYPYGVVHAADVIGWALATILLWAAGWIAIRAVKVAAKWIYQGDLK